VTVAIPVAEVVAGVPLDVELDHDGAPRRPVVVVDLAEAAALPCRDAELAASRLAAAIPVTVGVGADSAASVPPPVLEALSLTLVEVGAAGSHPADPRAVPVPSIQAALVALVGAATAAPRAAVTLGRVLRQTAVLPVVDGLAAESAAYSTLLAGPEFAGWVARRGTPRSRVTGEVRLERSADVLTVTLDRPRRRNAVDAPTRDALVDALALAAADPSLRVELRAVGKDFSAGGDLDEFGSTPDPATAHPLRLERSVGRAIDLVADRVTAYLHGACYGAGCELPAFAGHVVAGADTRLALPELSLGLIPGAGGTVSLTRRIGRWRTAWMGLTGIPVDAPTALVWGLADALA